MTFSQTALPHKNQVVVSAYEFAAGQRFDLHAIDRVGVELPVKILQGVGSGEIGLADAAFDRALASSLGLLANHQPQEFQMRQAFLLGTTDSRVEVIGRERDAQVGKVREYLITERRRGRRRCRLRAGVAVGCGRFCGGFFGVLHFGRRGRWLIAGSFNPEKLLELVRSGDERAFERLFARHRPYIRRVVALRLDPALRRRVDPSDPSDVIQETQLEAFRRIDDYLARRPMPFRLWLRRTAEKRLGMLRRRHGAARRSLEREVQLPNRSSFAIAQQLMASGLSPSEQFDQRELARLVRAAVAKLADADRELIIMRMYERLTNEEIACVLGIDNAAVRQRYGRALLRLRKILLESGLTDH